VPYRDAAPAVRAPEIALTAAARLVGVHGIVQVAYRLAIVHVALHEHSEQCELARAAERGELPTITAFSWRQLARDPAWKLAPNVLAGLVLIAGVLVALRTRGTARLLGATSALLAMLGFLTVSFAPQLTLRTSEALLAVAQVPILWALSKRGQRTFAWLTTTGAAGTAYALFVAYVRLTGAHQHRILDGDSGFLFEHLFVPTLDTFPFACAAIAGWLPSRDDLRGSPPEPPLGRAYYALLACAVSIAAFTVVAGFGAALDEPLREAWGTLFPFGGVEWVAPFAEGALTIGGIAIVQAAQTQVARGIAFVALAATALAGYPFPLTYTGQHQGREFMEPGFEGHYAAWVLCACMLVGVGISVTISAARATASPITSRVIASALLAIAALFTTLGASAGDTALVLAGLFGLGTLACSASLVSTYRAQLGRLAELERGRHEIEGD
jgi:hypothetical protein